MASQKFKELKKGKMRPDWMRAGGGGHLRVQKHFHVSFPNVCVKHKQKFFPLSRVLNAAVSGLRSSLLPFLTGIQLKVGLYLLA